MTTQGRSSQHWAWLAGLYALGATGEAQEEARHWSQLPSLPDAEGFAAPFAGSSGGALIVAGGANIVGDKWHDPFVKQWYDSVFVLEGPTDRWRTGFKLPRPLGYGVSITADDSVLCFGGSDSVRHYADAFRLRWKNGKLDRLPLPQLPQPCANACGALVGRTVYLAGGLESPSASVALHNFWALDLDAPEPIWQELEPWPGSERMLAVAGSVGGSFYLFSGTKLSVGADGKPSREYLRDAYRYTPGEGWKRLADLPRAAVAAPTPAPVVAGTGLLVITGDDGANVSFQPVDRHPGFPREALLFDPQTDHWTTVPDQPFSRATVPVVPWRGGVVFPNGEVRPRVRTPEVWNLSGATLP